MYRFNIFPETKLIVVQYQGDIYLSDITQLNLAAMVHPDYDPAFNGISDERLANIILSNADIRVLTDRFREHGLSGKWAHLISTPRSAVSADKYKQASKDIHDNNMFSSVAAAANYVGVADLEKYLFE